MRTKIDVSTVKFRVAGTARPRQVSKNDKSQKVTPVGDGSRPIWTVRLIAVDMQAGTTEQIFVEMAGDMPQLVVDEIATVHNLIYVPWAVAEYDKARDRWMGKIMRAFRADSISMADAAKVRAA